MQINLNQFSSILSQASSFFKNRILPSLANKKVDLIVSVVFSILGAYFLSRKCLKKPLSVDQILKKNSKESDLTKEEKIALLLKNDFNNKLPFVFLFFSHYKMSLGEKLEMAKAGGKAVTSLSFKGTNITDKQLQEVIENCPSLKELNLDNCKQLKNVVFKDLKNLETLSLSGCTNLSDTTFNSLLDLKDLKNLDLSHCSQFKDENAKNLPRNLDSLNLSYCSQLSNKGVPDLPRNVHTLQLAYCSRLTNAMLKRLPNAVGAINLAGCSKLTNPCLKSGLIKLYPKGE